MSLGTLSRWFTNLKSKNVRTAIARTYGLDECALQVFIRHLTYIRNVYAHHSRLWNRQFTVTMQLPGTKPKQLIADFHPRRSRKLRNTLVMLAWMLDRISPNHHCKRRLSSLIRSHAIDPLEMGFPEDYSRRAIWRTSDGGVA